MLGSGVERASSELSRDGHVGRGRWHHLRLPGSHGRTLLASQTFRRCAIRAWRPTLWRDKLAGGFTNSTGLSGDKFSTLTYFWTLAMQQGMVWIGSGMKPSIAYDKAAPRESLNYIGGYGGAMATNPFDDPQDMSPADLATAAAFGQRFATFLATGKTPNTPYADFTKK